LHGLRLSNTAVYIAGRIVEVVTGSPYRAAIADDQTGAVKDRIVVEAFG